MKEDEELQRNLESGNKMASDNLDVKAYQYVFKALKKTPETGVSSSFADKVIQKALAQKQQKESSRDMWWFGIGLFLLSVAFIVALAFIGFRVNLGFLRVLADYKGLILVGAVLIWVFNVLDKKLVSTRADVNQSL
jgi:hypothetical protein